MQKKVIPSILRQLLECGSLVQLLIESAGHQLRAGIARRPSFVLD
jgi:hypothetical protein